MYQTIIQKLQEQAITQKKLTMCFFDIDGTIFTAGWRIIKAPFYNIQTNELLKKNHIPFTLISGRQDINELMPHELAIEGFGDFDCIILSGGTLIHYREKSGKLVRDNIWHEKLAQTKWHHEEILEKVKILKKNTMLHFRIVGGNKFLVRIAVNEMELSNLEKLEKHLKNILPHYIRIDRSESLIKHNTTNIFSGNLLIMPDIAGKDNVIKYLLSSIHHYGSSAIESLQTNAYIFGDALVDIPMLGMKSDNKRWDFHQYLVHPTPLARVSAKKYTNVIINENEGPQAILTTMQTVSGSKQVHNQHNYFSAAQNNPQRNVSRILEPILNQVLPQRLSPNDISLLGLEYVKRGIQLSENNNIFLKLQGLLFYMWGNIIDLFDGIRARQNKIVNQDIPGQLVDGYADRSKEFSALHSRALQRENNNHEYETTIYAALSCFLPSIARAEAETFGITVPERDAAGGSALDRNKLLFRSFTAHIFNKKSLSYTIDEEIYAKNLATFENRMKHLDKEEAKSFSKTDVKNVAAFERFLLYVDLLQQADEICGKPDLPKFFDKFLRINVNDVRRKFNFTDYKLSLKSK